MIEPKDILIPKTITIQLFVLKSILFYIGHTGQVLALWSMGPPSSCHNQTIKY